jgi:AcrR family transcriptional regulator
LNAAIDCFWHRGYEATSVRDLAASMGLSGPSLYNAFGDKRALFVRALERYLDCSPRARATAACASDWDRELVFSDVKSRRMACD